jgi:putative oxidoreductase
MRLGHTALRTVVGVGFAAHGAQKLFGWFGGHGLEGTGQFFEQGLQMTPGKRNAAAAGGAELGGGLALAAGVATPVAAAALTSTMVTAILKVHGSKGFFSTEGGWEYNAVLIAAIAAIVDEEDGPLATLAVLAAGTIGSLAAIEIGKRESAKLTAKGAADASINGSAPAETPEPAAATPAV